MEGAQIAHICVHCEQWLDAPPAAQIGGYTRPVVVQGRLRIVRRSIPVQRPPCRLFACAFGAEVVSRPTSDHPIWTVLATGVRSAKGVQDGGPASALLQLFARAARQRRPGKLI